MKSMHFHDSKLKFVEALSSLFVMKLKLLLHVVVLGLFVKGRISNHINDYIKYISCIEGDRSNCQPEANSIPRS